MNTDELLKKYSNSKEHPKTVSRLSLALFRELVEVFPVLKNYDNKKDLNLLEKGAMLHDIGIYFEDIYKISHHKAGAKYIFENKPDDIESDDLPILCCLIRYHRKSLPKDSHEIYKKLNYKEKAKIGHLGSIIRLSDALDYMHIDFVENIKIDYDKSLNILTLDLGGNIILNSSLLKAVERKKDFFEAVYSTKVQLKC